MFEPYVYVQLYTDTTPEEFYAPESGGRGSAGKQRRKADAKDVNFQFQRLVFGTIQQPLYAILEPQPSGDVRIVAVYSEGRINDESAFAEFLTSNAK